MTGRHRQRGAVLAIAMVLLVLVLLGFAASYLVSRLTSRAGEAGVTEARLAIAAAALEQFTSSAARLPCPANPAVDTGVEVRAVGNTTCTFPGGTVPWSTIGMRREDALDTWGRKLSYRVYAGSNAAGDGSLVRDKGASMVDCDTVEPIPTLPASKLCTQDPDPYLRNTTPALFLAGKGLSVTDFGRARTDIAFVLISHGATGFGGYSTSGARRELPLGDERDNTKDVSVAPVVTFVAKSFSDPDVSASMSTHFDDVLLFRSITELVTKANLSARNWPEGVGTPFGAATVAAALGLAAGTTPPADTGQATIDFGAFSVTGFSGGSTATNISFDNSYVSTSGTAITAGGLGVFGSTYAGAGGNLIISSGNEKLRIDLDESMRKFAITLDDFGIPTFFGIKFTERVEFTFYVGNVQVGSTIPKSACREPDGILASYSIDVGVDFNRVEIRPLTASPTFFDVPSGLLISEFVACRATSPSCMTDLAVLNSATTCS